MRIWLYHSCRHSSVVAQDGLCEPSLDSGDTDQRNNILIDVVQELVENELRNSGRVYKILRVTTVPDHMVAVRVVDPMT
jgi:hypothetical protein